MKYFFAVFLSSALLYGQWSNIPETPLNVGYGIDPQVCPTENGDIYIAWLSESDYQVYLQHLDPDGFFLWNEGGLLISDFPNSSWIAVFHLNLITDHDGNAIITAVDTRNGDWQVFAWKISPEGQMLWDEEGIPVSQPGSGSTAPRLTALSDNSVVIAWNEEFTDIRMQRLSSDGDLLWGGYGLFMPGQDGALLTPLPLTSDNDAISLQWIRQTGGWPPQSELFMMQYSQAGEAIWEEPLQIAGPVAFPLGNWSQNAVLLTDGSIYSSWTEMTANAQTAKVQKTSNDGFHLWDDPVELSSADGYFRTNPVIVSGGESQELLSVWTLASPDQSTHGISAQRISVDGNRLWGNNGIPVVPLSDHTFLDLNASGIEEDIISVYIDQSSFSTADIFAFRLDQDGEFTWQDDIVQLTVSEINKSHLSAVKGPGCNFVVWSESGIIKTQCLRDDGTLGSPIIEDECFPDGDTNDDGMVNILDIVQIVNFIIGLQLPSEDQICSADMNFDENIDILDIVQILNFIII